MIEKLSEEVKNEPKIALDGGKYGINVIKEIFNWEKNINKNKASIILIEIDESIKNKVKELSEKFYPHMKIKFIADLNKNTRFLSVTNF